MVAQRKGHWKKFSTLLLKKKISSAWIHNWYSFAILGVPVLTCKGSFANKKCSCPDVLIYKQYNIPSSLNTILRYQKILFQSFTSFYLLYCRHAHTQMYNHSKLLRFFSPSCCKAVFCDNYFNYELQEVQQNFTRIILQLYFTKADNWVCVMYSGYSKEYILFGYNNGQIMKINKIMNETYDFQWSNHFGLFLLFVFIILFVIKQFQGHLCIRGTCSAMTIWNQ